MTTATLKPQRRTDTKRAAQPVWEIAESFPLQGEWTEDDYFDLPEDGRRVKLVDGCLEYLPVPTYEHERIIKRLYALLCAFVETARLGEVYFAGMNTRLAKGH